MELAALVWNAGTKQQLLVVGWGEGARELSVLCWVISVRQNNMSKILIRLIDLLYSIENSHVVVSQ